MHGSPQTSTPVPAPVADDALAARANLIVEEFIASRINFERLPTDRYELKDFKLERMRSLLRRLGDPQRGIAAVHIAGTKGKGSTAAMTAAMLTATGRQVGLFTSPHVEHFSERMTIDGIRPSPRELLSLLDDVRSVTEAMDAEGDPMRPTFFEVLTAMAWLHFRRRAVDVVVLETGLGGRLDATNVCEPAVCVITTISRDHERLLGNTLSAIAAEKAGIIKTGVPVICGVLDEEPREVIRQHAQERQAPHYGLSEVIHWRSIDVAQAAPDAARLPRRVIDIVTPWRNHTALPVPLAGEHQADNLALAVAAVDLLNKNGMDVSRDAVVEGIGNVRWPLRTEVVNEKPLVIVDAAHNVASMQALLRTLAEIAAQDRWLVFSTSKDKDAAGMLSLVNGAFDRVILTQFVNNPRAVPVDELVAIAQGVLTVPWTSAQSPAETWRVLREQSRDGDLVCATGSFFLAAEFRSVVRPSDR
jgi:dihydrofolate synthase/folylpolyglutamate synthase